MTDQPDSADCCEPDAEPDEPGEPRTHYLRMCAGCGHRWEGLHCPHDGFQNPCPGCGKRPERPDSAGLYHDRIVTPPEAGRPGRWVRLRAAAALPLLAMGCGQREESVEPRLTVDDYEKALATDPFLRGVAADRATRVVAFPMFDESTSDPIEVIRAACKVIEASTGRRPHCLMMSASHVARIVQTLRELIDNAERMLGIGRQAEGKFPTGWPWALREGRPSREEKRLRDGLPGWRSQLRGLTEEPEPHAGVRIVGSDRSSLSDVILIGGRHSRHRSAMLLGAALAQLDRDPMSRMLPITAPVFEIKPLPRIDIDREAWAKFMEAKPTRRPTGKGAQRRMSKPWAGREKR